MALLHIAASTSVIFDRLFGCLESLLYPVSKPVRRNLYPSCSRQFSISCGFEECNKFIKGQRLQLNLGSLLSSWFDWGAIAQQIAVVIIKRMKLVVVYKARGARVNSEHKATWCFNL